MNRLVWQPYMIEDGRIIDGTVYAEPIEDRAVIARIGGNLYRAHVVAQVTSMDRCIEVDLANRDPFVHEVMVPESALSWPVYRAAMSGLYGGEDDPLSKPPDEPLSESELRALHGDK